MTNKFKVGDKVKFKYINDNKIYIIKNIQFGNYISGTRLWVQGVDKLPDDCLPQEIFEIYGVDRGNNQISFHGEDELKLVEQPIKYLRWNAELYSNPPLNLTAGTWYRVIEDQHDMVQIIDDKGEAYINFTKYFTETQKGESMPENGFNEKGDPSNKSWNKFFKTPRECPQEIQINSQPQFSEVKLYINDLSVDSRPNYPLPKGDPIISNTTKKKEECETGKCRICGCKTYYHQSHTDINYCGTCWNKSGGNPERREFKVDKLGWYATKEGYKLKVIHALKDSQFIAIFVDNNDSVIVYEDGQADDDEHHLVKYLGPELPQQPVAPKAPRKFEFEGYLEESPTVPLSDNWMNCEYDSISKSFGYPCEPLSPIEMKTHDKSIMSKWRVTMEEIT